MEDHEFSDENIKSLEKFMNTGGLNGPFIALDVVCDRIHLNKGDVIALATLFGLSAE